MNREKALLVLSVLILAATHAIPGCVLPTSVGGSVPIEAVMVPSKQVPGESAEASSLVLVGRVVLLRFYGHEFKPHPFILDGNQRHVEFPTELGVVTDIAQVPYKPMLLTVDQNWGRTAPDNSILGFVSGCWPVYVERKSVQKEDSRFPSDWSHWSARDVGPPFSEGNIRLVFRPREQGFCSDAGQAAFLLFAHGTMKEFSDAALSELSKPDRRLVLGQMLDLFQQYVAAEPHGLNVEGLREVIRFLRQQGKKAGVRVAEDDAGALAMARERIAVDGLEAATQGWLRLAAFEGWTGTLEHLLSKGASSEYSNGAQCSPLHIAIGANQPQSVQALLAHGADPNAANQSGESPLYMAAEYGNVEIAKLLLEKGADVNKAKAGGSWLDFTPLQVAVLRNNVAMARLLLEHGASPNLGSKERLPLVLAEENHNAEMLQVLLEYHAHR